MELVLTIMANDRPGIVEQVAKEIQHQEGNWLESRLTHMAGKFAGIVRVEIPKEHLESTQKALHQLRDKGLSIHIELGETLHNNETQHRVEVVGNDRPGIVREVTTALAANNINVIDLQTGIEPASMSGGNLFRAIIKFSLREDQNLDLVVQSLENLSPDLMVDY